MSSDFPQYDNQVDETVQCSEHCPKCIEIMRCFYDYQDLADFDPLYAENGWHCSECKKNYNYEDIDGFPMNHCCETRCVYDLCQNCIEDIQDGTIKLDYLCPDKHPLKELNKKPNTKHACRKCCKDVQGSTRY